MPTVLGVTACDASFYANGINIRSGQAHAILNGTTYTIIAGNQQPDAGQIHFNSLNDGDHIHLDDASTT